ncbi:hypothetical protein MLD38_001344 [Melastoma candidum]|uniref:Uncharacterized protein n=1 Tax=Melastoma candidum TaxID=119954 RepID=A0ACB9SD12_9MYRT|nr:hypothetical protein MLD38_001344 [Melastoma candidum]
MVQATIIFEDMIKMKYFRNEWWGLTSIVDSAEDSNLEKLVDDTLLSASDSAERPKGSRKLSRKRKEPEGHGDPVRF